VSETQCRFCGSDVMSSHYHCACVAFRLRGRYLQLSLSLLSISLTTRAMAQRISKRFCILNRWSVLPLFLEHTHTHTHTHTHFPARLERSIVSPFSLQMEVASQYVNELKAVVKKPRSVRLMPSLYLNFTRLSLLPFYYYPLYIL